MFLFKINLFVKLKDDYNTNHCMENAIKAITNQSFISAIILTIALIFVGFILVRTKILKEGAEKTVSTIVMKVAFPCLAFVGFLTDFNVSQFGVLLISFVGYIILFALGRLIFIKVNKDSRNAYRVLFAMGQVTLFGLPISQAIFGDGILTSTNMIIFSFRIFLYVYSYFLISKIEFNKNNIGSSLKKAFINPVMIGMLLGLIVWVSQTFMPTVDVDGVAYSVLRIDKTVPFLYKVVNTIGSLASPVGMLLVGITLGRVDLKSAFTNKSAYIVSILRSFVAPAITIGFCLLWQLIFKEGSALHFDNNTIAAIVICFASPVSVVVNTYCVSFENEPILSSDTILLSTLMSILSVPLIVLAVGLIF